MTLIPISVTVAHGFKTRERPNIRNSETAVKNGYAVNPFFFSKLSDITILSFK